MVVVSSMTAIPCACSLVVLGAQLIWACSALLVLSATYSGAAAATLNYRVKRTSWLAL